MEITKRLDFRLKLGNFALALILCTVPTAITLATFTLFGIRICNELVERKYVSIDYPVKEVCIQTSIDTSTDYMILIWLFITLPTWRWFYLGHINRLKRIK